MLGEGAKQYKTKPQRRYKYSSNNNPKFNTPQPVAPLQITFTKVQQVDGYYLVLCILLSTFSV
jgi:hypothetical protein